MKIRFVSEIKKHAVFLAIGFAYFLWVLATDIYIPCLFNLITGFKCPGCGISHMIVAFCRLDFRTAFLYNPLLFFILPILIIFYIVDRIYYICTGNRIIYGKKVTIFCYVLIALIIIFWIVRNIPIN